MTWALLTIGTASKSKLSRVLPGGSRASSRWRSDAAAGTLGQLVLGQGGQEASGGPALLVGALGEVGPDRVMAGSRRSVRSSGRRPVSTVGRGHAASSRASTVASRPS